jgi:hypothetical protein
MNTGYIYVIIEREFIKTDEKIYKIGKTGQENFNRFNQYPKNSILLYYQKTNDYENMEKKILLKLKEKFIQKKNIGKEYFNGNIVEIVKEIIEIIFPNCEEYITESKEEIKKYYESINSKFKSDSEIFKEMWEKADNPNITDEEYLEIAKEDDRHIANRYEAYKEIVKLGIIEKYIMTEKIIKNKNYKDKPEKYKLFFYGEYNALKYIIICVSNDMDFGDYYDEENNKYMKIAGEFFYKLSNNETDFMSRYLDFQIPKIFQRRIDYIWDGIGNWKC